MRPRWMIAGSLALAWIAFCSADLRAALLTIDEAIEMSQKYGRPVFAVAGSKT